MNMAVTTSSANALTTANDTSSADFVTMTVGGQLFGIPVLQVRDVLGPQRITIVPLAPPSVAGSLNLRGRIVTAIDLRTRLGMAPRAKGETSMSVVVEHKGDLYSLIIDQVGEVIGLSADACEKKPATLDPRWQNSAESIYSLKDELLVVLNIESILQTEA